MKILCTGSAGFICGRLISRLIEQCHEVTGFDVAYGLDILNLSQVRSAVEKQDAVFHLAAVADLNWMRVHYQEAMDVNIRGTMNLAIACREVGARLFFASTCCVYGWQTDHPTTENHLPHPNELYAASKYAGEQIIVGLSKTHGLQYNLMRFATIYGPGTRPALGTHIFMGQALRGEPITVHGDGEQTRTLTYVEDLIDGMMALLHSGKLNDVWNLSAEREISANEMASTIRRVCQSDSPIVHIGQRPGQTFRESISAEKMRRECAWEAKTPWDTGIRQMLEWYMATNQVDRRYNEPTESKERVNA